MRAALARRLLCHSIRLRSTSIRANRPPRYPFMDSRLAGPRPPRRTQGRQASRLAYGGLIALVTLIGVTFALLAQTLPSISDTIGYVHAANRLASGHGLTFADDNNQVAGPYFSIYAFQIRRTDDPRMFLGFPPGFPILLAGSILVTGSDGAVHYVVPLLATAGLLATFWLGTLAGRNAWTGLWAAAILASTPDFGEFGTSSWSEIPNLTLLTAGLCFYLLSCAAERHRRQVVMLSVLGAILIVYSFLVRYASVAIVPALVINEIACGQVGDSAKRRRWAFWGLLGLGLAGILLFNQLYYGGALLTSYSPTHGWYPWPAFSLSYAFGPSPVGGRSLIEACRSLWRNFPCLLLAAPVGWLLLKKGPALMIGASTLGTVSLYATYAFAPTGINSRFLLPVFPLICVGVAQTVTVAARQYLSARWRRAAGLILAIVLCLPVPARVTQLESRNASDAAMLDYIHSITDSTPPNAVFLSYVYNDQIAFYGNRSVLNYRRIPPSDPEAGRYQMEVFEPRLAEAVDRLLQREIPVYYVEDRSPPFWDSLAILENRFAAEPTYPGACVYRLSRAPEATGTGDGSR